MKLPSLRQISTETRDTFRRFPFLLLDVLAATAAALILVDYEGPSKGTFLFNVLLAGILGIPLLLTLALVAEKRNFPKSTATGIQLLGIAALVAYAVTVPTDLTHAPLVTLFRFYVLATALHLCVAVIPFIAPGEHNGFWHYNKSLLLRILTALLYSVILYIGLAIALAALDNLFGVTIPGKRYFELWLVIWGIFNTWFFLAGIPPDLRALDAQAGYPKSLKVFAQYILFPIALIYFIILYAYLAKIIVTWEWPEGYVSKLILGFSATGMFLLLLLRPIADREENRWISMTERWFYILLPPLIVMLVLAVWRRVSEYGITEGRYLALALGGWLVFVALYHFLGKSRSIKVIPVSLGVLAFAMSFGPWGMFDVARESQTGRLEKLIARSNILKEGKISAVHGEVPTEDAVEIGAILRYLHDYHGFAHIQPWFAENLLEDSTESSVNFKEPAAVAALMGLELPSHRPTKFGFFSLTSGPFDVEGFSRVARLNTYRGMARQDTLGQGISYRLSPGMDSLTIIGHGDTLMMDLLEHAKHLLAYCDTAGTLNIPSEKMGLTASGMRLKAKLSPWIMHVQRNTRETTVTSLEANILYTVKVEQ